MNEKLLSEISKLVRQEILTYRESLTFQDIVVFTGCVLAIFKQNNILTSQEEKLLREKVLGGLYGP